MNATSNYFVREIDGGSDSDSNPDNSPEYYQPISAVDNNDSDTDSDEVSSEASDRHGHGLSNGYYAYETENRMSRMDLNGEAEEKSDSEDEEEERREESERAIMRAFREDENRRNAPLSEENSMRVMAAMRGVSFSGSAPDWSNQIPEHGWMDQLRRMRQPRSPTT